MPPVNRFQPHPAFPPAIAHRAPPAGQWPPAWASTWGDDRYGLWAELDVAQVVQRFRWIEPGRFLMGSPESEPERKDVEGPQHPVTLTQGYWLADTACTQALWLALVGGDNPSYFKGDVECPVEQVSWDDVAQQFLPKLQLLLPADTQATLPTEAQWEYACRTGMATTPFSWGDFIHPGSVNCNSSLPYNGGLEGEYRARTVPVRALPANTWGLYQMHGNVWEWCWDEPRSYVAGAAVNPTGAVGDGLRELRGGSWLNFARNVRSASRYQVSRDFRARSVGFRVVLRFK